MSIKIFCANDHKVLSIDYMRGSQGHEKCYWFYFGFNICEEITGHASKIDSWSILTVHVGPNSSIMVSWLSKLNCNIRKRIVIFNHLQYVSLILVVQNCCYIQWPNFARIKYILLITLSGSSVTNLLWTTIEIGNQGIIVVKWRLSCKHN